jgi:hypothetical protein
MFKVTINNNEYEVKFRHYHRDFDDKYPGTACFIVGVDGFIRVGETLLHPKDNYDRNIGRKMSMARALKESRFPKGIRKMFWKEYFEVRGKIN